MINKAAGSIFGTWVKLHINTNTKQMSYSKKKQSDEILYINSRIPYNENLNFQINEAGVQQQLSKNIT